MSAGRYELVLAKEDFKFSAAHFTLFPDGSAERLHGHDYRVRVVLEGPALGDAGLLVDLAAAKRAIRALCGRLDERVLLPEKGRALRIDRDGGSIEVRRGERAYRFPADEVVALPVENISIELLARVLWDELAPALRGSGAAVLRLEVEETPGQSARYTAALAPAC